MRNSSKRLSAAGFSAALVLLAALSALYLFGGVSAETWDYNIPRRLNILAAIAVVGTAVGLSAVVFQTVTENYVLTPGIMGLDNLYIFIQTLIIYFLGSGEGGMMTSSAHFLLTLALMAGASVGVFVFMFRINGGDVYFVVLAGLVFGIAFGGLSNFMQVIIDPSEFSVLEGRMFASFNRINVDLLGVSAAATAAVFLWLAADFKKLDVLSLGRNPSIALGVEYNRTVLKTLVSVSILTSAATVLVGPITFLGILIVSIARFIFPTYRHCVLVPGTVFIGICILVFGMLIAERMLQFAVPLGVIINFAGGIFFIGLMLKIKRL